MTTLLTRWRRGAVLGAVGVVLVATGCSDGGDDDIAVPATSAPAITASPSAPGSAVDGSAVAARCLVRLHGKSGTGAPTVVEADVTIIAPTGNAEGWGGRQWLYFPDAEYEAAREIVADATTGCEQVIVHGFSNGAAFAAKLYCRGEALEGRLVRVVVDDPVVDHGVDGCAPDPAVEVALYWTGALADTARAGWDCAEGDWTCEGGETIGIEAYGAALGAEVLDSPIDEHAWYLAAPELSAW